MTALVFGLALSLVASTSYARYLRSIGPAACCQSHCPRGHGGTGADADRCCSTHLGVVPDGLAAGAPDAHHAVSAVYVAVPVVVVPWTTATLIPSVEVVGRGSPPGSLLASHTALLI